MAYCIYISARKALKTDFLIKIRWVYYVWLNFRIAEDA